MALTDKLTAIADAIRSKTGESGTMTPAQMPTKIASIPTIKKWSITITNDKSAVTTLISNDSWLAQNWQNSDLIVILQARNEVVVPDTGASITMSMARNSYSVAGSKGCQIGVTSRSTGTNYIASNYRLQDGGTHNGGELNVNSNGDLIGTYTGTTYLAPNTFDIYAFLM